MLMYKGRVICLNGKYPFLFWNGKKRRLHLVVWEEANGPIPKGYEIHHKDFDKMNWSLDNLEILSEKDHVRFHKGWIKNNGVWTHKPCCFCKSSLPLSAFYQNKRGQRIGRYASACKDCIKEKTRAYRKNQQISSKPNKKLALQH